MSDLKKILRWLRATCILQTTLIFLADLILTRKIYAFRYTLQASLYQSGVGAVQVNQVNNAFDSITTNLSWITLAGMVLTIIVYFALERVVKKHWQK